MAKSSSLPLLRTLFSEFIGTFFLVTTWCSVSMNADLLGALAVASTLMVCVYALGEVSGANFNPAVSLGLALCGAVGHGDMTFGKMGLYWCAQLLAALFAAFTTGLTHNSSLGGPSAWTSNVNTTLTITKLKPYESMNALGPGASYGASSVFFAEAIYTALLVLVVLNVATCGDEKKSGGGPNNYFGLAIGFVITAGAMAIGNVTQCSLNPAVSLGATFGDLLWGETTPDKPLLMFALYAVAELAGACVGFGFFYIVRMHLLKKKKNGDYAAGADAPEPAPSKLSVYTAELLGTFYLVLTVCLVVQQQDAPLIGIVGIASSLMVGVFAMGKVSGANFNPAVSLGLLLTKQLPVATFALYSLTQVCGGILAALYSMTINDGWRLCQLGRNRSRKIALIEQPSWGAVAGAEITYTFLLVFVVLNVAVRNPPNQYYGLAIGFVIICGGVSVGQISGGMFNPAVATGLDVGAGLSVLFGRPVEGEHGWFWAYSLFEFTGAALAAGVVTLLRPPAADSIKDVEESGSSEESE